MADPTIAWGSTDVILIPQSYLTFVSGTFYRLDTNAFRLFLKAEEAKAIEGMTYPKTHRHNTEVTLVGTTFARTFEILSPYSVEFVDGQYTVELINTNNNIFDVAGGILVQNQVQVIPTNSAGLIVIASGSGLSAAEQLELQELHEEAGLSSGNAMTVTPTSRAAGSWTQTISGDGDTTTTITRD